MESWHGTTILAVRKNGQAVVAGDGQVSLGQTIIKPNARKVRRLGNGSVIGSPCSSGSSGSSSSITGR
jgi:ATP-dependent HslUV protease subunit HslV